MKKYVCPFQVPQHHLCRLFYLLAGLQLVNWLNKEVI
jgi:hypothetical protein